MDNQQATLITNNNYFAGLVDSDFGVNIYESTYKGKLQLQPRITFTNTRFNLIELCASILYNNNINHYIGNMKASIGRDAKRITIQRLSKCIEFVDLWLSFCIVRRPQLELIKNFCIDRMNYVNDYGWKYKNTPYNDVQRYIYKKLKLLNLNYNYDNGHRNYTFSWLGGMIDGDGSVYFSVTKRRSKYKHKEYIYTKIQPWIKVTTGSDTAKNNIIELYNKYCIKYYIDTVKSKASKKLDKNGYKFHYSILVKEFNDLLILIRELNGKIFAKQEQLNLMKEYIDAKKINRHNTKDVFDIVQKVSILNNSY